MSSVTNCKMLAPKSKWNDFSFTGTGNELLLYGPGEDFDLSIDDANTKVVTATPATTNGLVQILTCAPLFKQHLGLNTRINITNTLEIAEGTVTAAMLENIEFNTLLLTVKVKTQAALDRVFEAIPASTYPLLAIDASDAREELTVPDGREVYVRLRSGEGKQGRYTPKINGLVISFQ